MGMTGDESQILHLPSLDNANLEAKRSEGTGTREHVENRAQL